MRSILHRRKTIIRARASSPSAPAMPSTKTTSSANDAVIIAQSNTCSTQLQHRRQEQETDSTVTVRSSSWRTPVAATGNRMPHQITRQYTRPRSSFKSSLRYFLCKTVRIRMIFWTQIILHNSSISGKSFPWSLKGFRLQGKLERCCQVGPTKNGSHLGRSWRGSSRRTSMAWKCVYVDAEWIKV